MIRQDRELLAELMRVNTQVPPFVMALLDGRVSPDEEAVFAERLAKLADSLRRHAADRDRVVIEGEPGAGAFVNGSLPAGSSEHGRG